MTYARYTQFEYDPARRDEVLAHWRDPETSHPTNEPGFVRGFVLDSVEQPGLLRVVTLWGPPEQFGACFASPGHQAIGGTMGERSAKITVRDGLEDVLLLAPPAPLERDDAGHVRIIRARIRDNASIPALREFWRTSGRKALESAEGVHASRAYVDEAAGLFIIQVWWSDAETATAFVASDEHESALTVPLDQWVDRIDRAEATPLD